jgi:hypothetical protein
MKSEDQPPTKEMIDAIQSAHSMIMEQHLAGMCEGSLDLMQRLGIGNCFFLAKAAKTETEKEQPSPDDKSVRPTAIHMVVVGNYTTDDLRRLADFYRGFVQDGAEKAIHCPPPRVVKDDLGLSQPPTGDQNDEG